MREAMNSRALPQSEQNSLRGHYRFIKGGAYLPMIC